ncbi:MAG: pyruvate, water dikinase [Solirubrobacteraceae bacterium]|nr:pyruvate, water dikinase [Solirubrobacteraceae bacterium]
MSSVPAHPPPSAHTRPLAELRAADEDRFGGKSTSLGELIAGEIPVPPGFAVATSAFHGFLEAGGLRPRIDEAMAGVRVEDVGTVQAAADAIRDAVCTTELPGDVRSEIGGAYEALAAEAGSDAVAVRSSAVGEDSGEATFAGQQETYLWVRGADGVCDAVRDCWASTFSAPAMSYRAKMAAGRAPEMGVTVQLMVDAAVSGVMFTCNPVSGDPSVVAIDASWGLGLGVVGGEVTPDEYLVSKVTGEVVRRTVSAKHIEYRVDPSGRGTVCVPVDEARQSEPCLDEPALATLVAAARRVQKHFGAHQDIEWALTGDGTLFVVQSRPVTATGAGAKEDAAKPAPADALALVMSKFGAGRR